MRKQFLSFATLILILYSCQPKNEEADVPDAGSPSMVEQIIFPTQPEHTHGPTVVELSNGDLLAAWFQGSGERWADDVRIMGARKKVGANEWSSPFVMADAPGFPDVNPMLFVDQQDRLWLMWYTVLANLWETSLPRYKISENYTADAAPVWTWQDNVLLKPGGKTERGIQPDDPFVQAAQQQIKAYEPYFKDTLLSTLSAEQQQDILPKWEAYKSKLDSLARGQNMLRNGRIYEGEETRSAELGYPLMRRIGWQTKNKPFLMGDRIIVPLYSDGLDCSIFAYTDDGGQQWETSNPVIGGIGIQPTILQKNDGTLVAYLRDNGPPPYRMQYTVSKDSAKHWSIPRDAELPNPGAGFDGVTLKDGNWLMVYNDTEDGRHSLALALSEDEGKTWPWIRHLEHDTRGEQATQSHYPAIIEGKDGRIHMVYSYFHNDQEGSAKTIKYVSVSPEWVKEEAN
ncbi:exo-alpha-sialidase [Porifericola rhodea]|uniref:sialidase family protein n=1 Tax=Porifericola rhodea TaxID=930972 RepID=UPI00266574B1|nr:exo-alpha-sialidase [Porifericola rhodea]WKN30391.1 exo-alpha-sialidase [Porifericola rhodea]